MPDDDPTKPPEQQGDPPAQQGGSASASTGGDNIDWEARYRGSVSKINELQGTIKTLQEQQAAKTSEIEQLRAQLTTKDVEKDAYVGEHKKQLEKALSENSELRKELTQLRALKAKMDMAKKLEAPQLMPILDRIPYAEDPEALESIMKDFVSWGQGFAKEREAQLMAGVTETVAQASAKKATPNSHDEWLKLIQSSPAADQDRLWKEYWEWGANSQQ
jgi:small-conductance mechanosensitive channel